MTTILHEAIAAARAGDIPRAEQLAAENVRANPDDANSWYLLSQLVESDARRAAYLGKTLALDPNHARARIEFDALPPALVAELTPTVELPAAPEVVAAPEAVALSEAVAVEAAAHEPDDLLAVATAAAGAAVEPAAAEMPVTPVLEVAAPEELPEWLKPLSPEPVAAGGATVVEAAAVPAAAPIVAAEAPVALAGTPAAVAEATPPAPAPSPRPAAPRPKPAPAKRNGGNQALSILLGLLALLTVVVLGFLIYLLFV